MRYKLFKNEKVLINYPILNEIALSLVARFFFFGKI